MPFPSPLCYHAHSALASGAARSAGKAYYAALAVLSAAFVLVMALFYRNSRVSIAASVLYVYAMFGMVVRRWKASEAQERSV